jgi:penicillin-binding protein A
MNDPTAQYIRRLAALSAGFLGVLMAATFYWGFVRADALAARPDNPRRSVADRRIARGRILDRRGTVLAETRFDGQGAPHRLYHVPSAAPVVGFQTWRYGAGGQPRATYGAGGAEAAYDSALRGDLGQSLRQLVTGQLLHRTQPGHDVMLTLDADLQAYAAGLLGDRSGAIVVLDTGTGAVRAMVSQPTFDPAQLDGGQTDLNDPRRPLLNRATQGLYAPGSSWKTVTLAGALEAGLTRLGDEVNDGDAVGYFGGFGVRCNNNPPGVNRFDIAHAFAYSCNLTFARLADQLGADRYRALAQRFGLDGPPPPFPLPVARSVLGLDDRLDPAELASAGFGQGQLLVTPLAMALVAAAVARDGTMPVPYLLADVPGVAHREIADATGVWRRATRPDVAGQVREAMVTSVRDGWARSAVAGLDLTAGGKTGTAQLGPGQAPHSWFIGFAPADEPQVAVAVLVENGGEGAATAAPIGGRVLRRALQLHGKDGP